MNVLMRNKDLMNKLKIKNGNILNEDIILHFSQTGLRT